MWEGLSGRKQVHRVCHTGRHHPNPLPNNEIPRSFSVIRAIEPPAGQGKMQPTPSAESVSRRPNVPAWVWGVAVAIVAIICATPSTRNMFVQDDQPAIIEDDRLHDPSQWIRYWNEPYWPTKYGGDLFRPLASTLLAAQWPLADGAPLSYRIISITLSAATSIGVLGLLLILLPTTPAVLAALLFAVHPVHVEAIAVAVNQGELLVGLISALALWGYIVARRRGPLGWQHRWGLFAAALAGGLIKENAAILPFMLLAAEGTILADTPRGSRWRDRWREAWRPQVMMWLALAVVLVLRYRVHAGEMRATFTAEGIDGLSMTERAYTVFAGVVPEWLRLLLWPATLQADYSPREIMPLTSFTGDVLLGLLLAGLILALAIRTARRAPVVSFGAWWTILALGPVSNILVPTGIVLAERTLYLPSVGAMIAVGGLLMVALRAPTPRWRPYAVIGLTVLVAGLGVSRSRSRFTVWRTPITLWRQTVIDAPDSYRARFALGYLMTQMGWNERGEVFMRDAIELYDRATGQVFTVADRLRHSGRCAEALPYYRRALEVEEFAPGRASYIACLAYLGHYQEGRDVALVGIGTGHYTRVFLLWFRMLDAARRNPPPVGTVTFPADKMYLFTEALQDPNATDRRPQTTSAEGR